MKKIILILFVLLIGDGSLINMKNLDSYNMIINISIGDDIKIKGDVYIDDIGKMNLTTFSNGIINKEERYFKENITYINKNDIWYFSKENNIFNFDDLKLNKTLEYNKYEITNIEEILNEFFIEDNDFIGYAYIEDGCISKIDLSFKTIINDEILPVKVKIDFKDLNKEFNIKLPKEVMNSKDIYHFDIVKKIEDYIFKIEYNSDKKEIEHINYMKYNNFDKVDLELKYGIVTSGIIEMDNYKYIIKNSHVIDFEKIK